LTFRKEPGKGTARRRASAATTLGTRPTALTRGAPLGIRAATSWRRGARAEKKAL
jgi:hypothetical protein